MSEIQTKNQSSQKQNQSILTSEQQQNNLIEYQNIKQKQNMESNNKTNINDDIDNKKTEEIEEKTQQIHKQEVKEAQQGQPQLIVSQIKNNESEQKKVCEQVKAQDFQKQSNEIAPQIQNQKSQKKDNQANKNVQITKKQLKKFLKLGTDLENLKKQNQSIKKQYNKVAKELISTRQQLDKKSLLIREIEKQIRQLQEKNQKMENQYNLLVRKIKEQQKNLQKQVGLQQTIKQLQKIIDVSTTNQHVYQRQAEKYKQILRIQKQMNTNLKTQVEELRHISSQYFLLKQQVVRLSSQLRSLKDAKQQYPKMFEKYQHLQQINEKLKETIQDLQVKLQTDKVFVQKLQKKIDHLNQDKKALDRRLKSTQVEKQQLQGQFEAIKMEIDDQRAQIEVQRKRYISEIKDLKLALHYQHQKLKLTEIQLQESKKKEKKTVNLEGIKFSSLSKQDLFNLIQQLQMKNASIKQNLSSLVEEISTKEFRIKQLQTTVMSLTRQLVKALPNFEQSQGMQYVQKQIIQMGKGKKQDWGQIVEKTIIENLRLKNSVTALGEEYNMRMREGMEKMGK